jgi:hypothetical protein
MSDEKFHFQIPKDNIRNEKYEKKGFGISYPRLNYYEHGEMLLKKYDNLYQYEATKTDFNLASQIFFQVETPANRAIKNEKVKLQGLGINLLNYSSDNTSTGIAYIEKTEYDILITKITKYKESAEHVGRSNISIIENILPIPSSAKIVGSIDPNSGKETSIVFTLYSTLPFKDKDIIIKRLIADLKPISTNIKSRIFSNGISSLTCKIKESLVSGIIDKFTTINDVKLNSSSIIGTSLPRLHQLPGTLSIAKPISTSSICVIDSSVHRHNKVFTGLITKIITHLPPSCIYPYYDHGTFVASRCIFGDNIDSCLSGGHLKPYCKIINVQVFGKLADGKVIGHEIYDLMGIIEDTVIAHYKTVQVYNLSLGDDISIKNGRFSDFAKLLDYLSKEHKVLFIVAGGNIKKLIPTYPIDHFDSPLARINSPGESLLSLTVGSIAKYFDKTSLASLDEVSPFSRIGPGADGGIKPELVAHGGNLQNSYKHSPRLGAYGICNDGSGLSVDNGTSYAAPIISQYAQQLFDLYPNSNPNLVKALLCHFAEKRNIPIAIISNPKNFVGFGEPIIERATQAGPNNAVFIFEGKLDQSNYQFVSFHVPKSLASENKNSKLRLKITITYDPPVNVSNDLEYSQTRISALLCKPTISGMKQIGISDETTYSMPWNPILHFEKSFSRGYLTGEWELRLRLYTRGSLLVNYKQDYAVTVEIIDELGIQNIYADIENDFGLIYKKFKLRSAA